MKKIFLILGFMCFCMPVHSKMVSDVYVIRNSKDQDVIKSLNAKIPNTKIDDNILYTANGNFYYYSIYQDGTNSNIFFVCDKENHDNTVGTIKNLGYKSYRLADKDLSKRYSRDYNKYIQDNNIPVKYIGKKSKDKKYNPYSKPLNNSKLEEVTIINENIKIIRTKYKAKSEVQDYADAYEYSITNNNNYPITLIEVGSNDFIHLQEIAKRVVDVNYSDFIPIYGLVRAIRTDVEKNKFTRIMPHNQQIEAGESLRILTLSHLQTVLKVNFIFNINNKEYKFIFKQKE